ncbi:DUF4335 domain-containing protein [Acaryochloris sp. 'Moss Beach']|uniref:DUF4335 domain-containing protein n=1 Tax=Acaryochloris sp. 'Moss Beach' TaxID=2740837 RepID=UPI001F2D0078|nr:DUF4335 domain-containing protein [Acaryochloris sp. 'Moss Beach']UJB71577.1 DUF4335 domain-containing protein [Acaryochloris sp. 'Moss Beach']
MTIQRPFILPNCTLNLEGISNSISDAALGESLDVLLRLECQFGDLKKPLIGGLDLLNSLIQATNQCTQSWMSGIPHRRLTQLNQDESAVHLLPKEEDGFELTIPTELLNETPSDTDGPVRVGLTTLQLFDLVEALDQLLADQQTLPNLSLAVRPLSRAEAASGQGLQKSASAVVGAASVAIAASIFYLLPVPQASAPPKDLPKAEPTSTETPAPGTLPGVPPIQVSPSPGESPGESPNPESTEESPSPGASPEPEVSP